jgi:hypothetical protein
MDADFIIYCDGGCTANLLGARRPAFLMDSKLVAQQVNGWWAVKGETDSPLAVAYYHCVSALRNFDRWAVQHLPREQNKRADWLVSGLLGHGRTLKKPPGIELVEIKGKGRPGWRLLAEDEKAGKKAA